MIFEGKTSWQYEVEQELGLDATGYKDAGQIDDPALACEMATASAETVERQIWLRDFRAGLEDQDPTQTYHRRGQRGSDFDRLLDITEQYIYEGFEGFGGREHYVERKQRVFLNSLKPGARIKKIDLRRLTNGTVALIAEEISSNVEYDAFSPAREVYEEYRAERNAKLYREALTQQDAETFANTLADEVKPLQDMTVGELSELYHYRKNVLDVLTAVGRAEDIDDFSREDFLSLTLVLRGKGFLLGPRP